MSALSDSRDTRKKEIGVLTLPMLTSTTIYKGSIVAVTSGTGYAIPATASASLIVMGVARQTVVNSGASGAKDIEVYIDGLFKFDKVSAAVTDIGVQMFVADDQTVGDSESNSVKVGICVGFVGTTEVWVRLRSPELF